MATFRLSPDEWTPIIPSGTNADKMVAINFGRAEVRFVQPGYGEQAPFTLAIPHDYHSEDLPRCVVPSPVGMEARAKGNFAIVSTGDW